ncbi:IS66 family transposase zinc-finger binding domain-containing protein [Roseibium sp. HPY-6]|uniref:IS66 family transposase zinc-finger binding domain-containing protein n=1 Tax=Roseibium sp. HPY-6 TaxID=3229852 RepID=UPI00338E1E88
MIEFLLFNGEDVTEELDYIPGGFIMNRISRPRLACSGCETICQSPLAEAIGRHVRAGQAIFAYDTPTKMQVKGKCATARIWTYVRDERPWGGDDPPAAW